MTHTYPFFAPEVLQTSGMDCGPAALKSLLTAVGVHVNYQRLRQACRTSADGTSIDMLEGVCTDLGLDAYQEMVPLADAVDVFDRQGPCLLVTRMEDQGTHFVVFWRRIGPWIQIMDPARGRRWVRRTELERELFVHKQPFDDELFRQWFTSTAWCSRTRARLRALGESSLLTEGQPLPSMREIGAIDASARFVERLAKRGAIPRSARPDVLRRLIQQALTSDAPLVPTALTGVSKRAYDGVPVASGAVFLAVRARGNTQEQPDDPPSPMAKAVLGSDEPTPFGMLLASVREHGASLLPMLGIVALFVSLLTTAEMLFLRAAFNARSLLSLPQQRFAGTAMYLALIVVLLALETRLASGILRLGRSLELHTRIAMLRKLPRLPDAYFRTRPMSDVTSRSQGLTSLKPIPEILVALARQSLEGIVTVVALSILYPGGLPWLVVLVLFSLVAPCFTLRARSQIEQRVQAHAGALGHVYLDTLMGLFPLRTHGGQTAMRAEQEGHLTPWRTEANRSIRLFSLIDALQAAGTTGAVLGLLSSYVRSVPTQGAVLLMAFWALRLPLHARGLSLTLQRLPGVLASVGRLLEPLTADESPEDPNETEKKSEAGISIEVENVSVLLSAERVLSDVSLSIGAGEHVAIVGSSGAGKSTLLALLLGVLDAESGHIRCDGTEMASYGRTRLRRETVWVDPAVQLWNRPLFENLHFGNPAGERRSIQDVIDALELTDLLTRLPEGLASPLGESGCLVSGGEGQRVRLGRAFLRRGARLVLLDEAFRGLDRDTRRRLSRAMRARAEGTTLIEVTHDVVETRDFDRVIVIEGGTVIEQGAPDELLWDGRSRYAALVEADLRAQHQVWNASHWRRFVVARGRVELDPGRTNAA